MLIIGAIVAAHVAVVGFWLAAPTLMTQVWGSAGARSGKVYEVIRYYDITPEGPSGTIQLAPELADSLGIVQSAQ